MLAQYAFLLNDETGFWLLAQQALPFVVERPSARQHKAELEARLAEIEEALALFSRRTVLVKLEEEDSQTAGT